MMLLAIDLYGIRPFEQPKRISLKPGFNTIVGKNGSGKSMIYQALSSVLMDTPPDRIAFFPDKPNQAAVTFQLKNDPGVYRIARDYKKGIWNLSKVDTATNKFASLENDRNKIFAWLSEKTGGLNEKGRGLLFLFDPRRLPSRIISSDSGAQLPLSDTLQADTAALGLASFSGVEAPRTTEAAGQDQMPNGMKTEKEKTLREAEQKLEAMTHMDDEMFQKRDEAIAFRKCISQVEELQEKIKRMEEVLTEKFSIFAAEGLISPKQIADFEAEEKVLAADFDRFEEEGQSIEAALILKKQAHQRKDPVLFTGWIVIVLSFVLPFVIPLSGPFRYLFLAGVLFGSVLTALGYFRRMKRISAQTALEAQLLALDEKVRQREHQFEKTHAEVYTRIKKTASKNVSALKTQQEAYSSLRQKKESASARISEILDGKTVAELSKKAEKHDEAVRVLEEKLKSYQALSEEVYRLQEALRDAEADTTAQQDNTFSDLPGLAPVSRTPPSSFFSALLNIGENGTRPNRERLAQDANILYRHFRPQNTQVIQLNANGEIGVGQIALHQLSPGVADQLYLSIALSALSQFSKIAFPLFLDDPFEALDPPSKAAAVKILKVIAKRRQIILFTAHTEYAEEDRIIPLVATP